MTEKMVVAVATIEETGERVIVTDQNNHPVVVTLAEALLQKFKGFPCNFADVRDMYNIIEIEIN
jgi:hypothetical protein